MWLERAAAAHPARTALETATGSLDYSALLSRARGARMALAERGVEGGDRVAISLPAGADFVATLHGCFMLGARAQPIDLRLSDEERAQRSAGAALVVSEPLEPSNGWRSFFDPRDAGAVAAVMYTSGTSGAPTAVELTYSNWQANAAGSALAIGLDLEERWLCALPLAHVGGLSILIRSAIYGTTVVLHERFDARKVVKALAEERITVVSLVPTMLARVLEAGLEHPPGLRCALLGGAPAPPALLERAAAAGVPVAQTYGLTEMCSQVTTSPPGDPATAGPPLTGTEVRIAEDGEILVTGPSLAPSAHTDEDGFLSTGDLGSLDERGRLTVSGRKADTIVSGGENVAPAEVEAILLAHPAVSDAGVFGRSDPEWGEAVSATVILRPEVTATEDELRAHCAEHLARFKVPKDIRFASTLPRTPSGKLLRRALAD